MTCPTSAGPMPDRSTATPSAIGPLDQSLPAAGARCASALHEAEQVPGDVADLDLLGALGDPVPPVVTVDVLERLVARVADAAVDLHRAVGRLADEPVRAEVAHRDPVADPADATGAAVHVRGGRADERPQPLDRLALGERLAERHALARNRHALGDAVVRRPDPGRSLADPVLVHEEQR